MPLDLTALTANADVVERLSWTFDLRTEADPLWTDATGQIGILTGSVATLESNTLGDPELEGVVLRYGSFYGPGTYFASGGLYATMLKRRLLPMPRSRHRPANRLCSAPPRA